METPETVDARLHLRIDPIVDRELRIACIQRRLTLSEAVEAAVRLWLDSDPDELDGRVKENC